MNALPRQVTARLHYGLGRVSIQKSWSGRAHAVLPAIRL
jgi:hypothetical protein